MEKNPSQIGYTENGKVMAAVEDHVEVEWQFEVDDFGPVERWLRDLPASIPIAIAATDADEHLDTYFDTSDWRIFRSGYVLRLRRTQVRAELTLKSTDRSRNGFVQRREVTQQLADAETDSVSAIEGEVGERVAAIRGRKDVEPLFAAITRRKRFRLWREGREVGELALDYTTFVGESFEDQTQLMRVEIETTADQTERLKPFVDALVDACGLRPAPASKFASGAAIVGLHPSRIPDVGTTKFDRDSSITEMAQAVLRRQFIELLRREPGTRLGDDVEELHDMRVAARRLRAALSLFAPYFPSGFDAVRDELRWVAAALGEVRDLDVQLAEIRGWKERLDSPDALALDLLLHELNRRRDTARDAMLKVLDSDRYERFVSDFSDKLSATLDVDKSEPAVVVVPDLILRRYGKFRRRADRLGPSSPDPDYHRVRIDGKRLRYALEFVSPLYGKIIGQLIESLVDVQDLLGRHQDSIVAIEHLREIAWDPIVMLPSSTIFAMGRVAEGYARAAAESRDHFPKAYKRMTGKRFDRLQRELRHRARRRPSHPVAQPNGTTSDGASDPYENDVESPGAEVRNEAQSGSASWI